MTAKFSSILDASRIADIARQHTHPLYRYPASMSPTIASSVIEGLTDPGDSIFDPFCGGGTTAIEALVKGRLAICSDISELACFVTKAKAQPIAQRELAEIRNWLKTLGDPAETLKSFPSAPIVTKCGDVYAPRSCGLLKAILRSAEVLNSSRSRRAAQLIGLRTGQIAFDSREGTISPAVISRIFRRTAVEVLDKLDDYSHQCQKAKLHLGRSRRLSVMATDAERMPSHLRRKLRDCSLVLTSPPYPGVHVLYHRWQIRGRKEVALPFNLLGLNDGHFEAHYTLAPRSEPDNKRYFERITRIFSLLNSTLRSGTPIVQVVAFARPQRQLRQYLAAMEASGLEQELKSRTAPRIVKRDIPNSRWYVRTDPTMRQRKEYVLFHRTTG